jgi:hypothetical protein
MTNSHPQSSHCSYAAHKLPVRRARTCRAPAPRRNAWGRRRDGAGNSWAGAWSRGRRLGRWRGHGRLGAAIKPASGPGHPLANCLADYHPAIIWVGQTGQEAGSFGQRVRLCVPISAAVLLHLAPGASPGTASLEKTAVCTHLASY